MTTEKVMRQIVCNREMSRLNSLKRQMRASVFMSNTKRLDFAWFMMLFVLVTIFLGALEADFHSGVFSQTQAVVLQVFHIGFMGYFLMRAFSCVPYFLKVPSSWAASLRLVERLAAIIEYQESKKSGEASALRGYAGHFLSVLKSRRVSSSGMCLFEFVALTKCLRLLEELQEFIESDRSE